MKEVVLYIAMSLDGFIADREGGVEWLAGDGTDPENPGSYPEFYETVDTVILGYRTYRQVAYELFPQAWIYRGKKSYVITHRKLESTEEIVFTDRDPGDLVGELRGGQGPGIIWVCGGAAVANQLLEADLVDRLWVSVIPTVLGGGVPLFSQSPVEKKLTLLSTRQYNGIVDLVYGRRG